MAIHKKKQNLWLIDLDQKLEGFRRFISCWIYSDGQTTFLVDPGPTSTITVLLAALKQLNINKVDYILLTHIHIDHAGGSGKLLNVFPEAQIICHERAIKHMVDPENLWQSSLSVLGKIAEEYGVIAAIPQNSISYQNEIKINDLTIEVIETPGHAMHHLNYRVNGLLFAGEVAGVITPADSFYLRIATPPKFVYEIYKESLFKAAALDCETICFGHYGLLSSGIDTFFKSAKEQLELWLEITRDQFLKNNTVKPDEIFNKLLVSDILLKSYKNLPADIQKREKYFAENSIKGMLGYIKA